MKFTPVNRYIEIEVREEKSSESQSGIVLPDDFKPTEEQHAIVKIKGWAEDVKFRNKLWVDHEIIVDRSMIEEIKLGDETVQVVLENYVVGIL